MYLRPSLHSVLLVLATLLYCGVNVSAQNLPEKEVKIVNGSTPIPFAAIINISTSEGSFCDGAGVVTIPNRGPSDTLVVKFIGFETFVILPGVDIGEFISLDESLVSIDAVLISASIVPGMRTDEVCYGSEISMREAIAVKKGAPVGTTGDLLRRTGQVHVQQSQQGGGSPVIRGFEANRILLVVDGVRLNNAIYRSGHVQNAITIDPNAIEQVRVILGPSSVRFGSDALGGVIHFKTRRTRFISDRHKKKFSGIISTKHESSNNSTSYHALAQHGGPKWGTVVSFSRANYGDLKMGGWRAHGDSTWGLVPFMATRINGVDSIIENNNPMVQSPTGYSQNDFLHKFRFAIKGGAIETNVQVSRSSKIARFDKLNDTTGDGNLKWAEWNYGPQERLLTSINWEQYSKIPGSVHTTLAYQKISESRIKRQFGGAIREVQLEEVDVLSLSSVWVSFPTLGDGWDFEAGVDGQWNGVSSSVLAQYPEGSLIIDPEFGGELLSRYPNNGSDMMSWASFATAKRNLGNHIYRIGTRYSHSSINAFYEPTSALALPFDEIHSSHGALTGSLAAEIPLSKNIQTITSFSSGFRHPNIDDAAKFREKGGYVLVPNDSLRAEYIYSFDESIYWNVTPSISVNSAIFVSLWADYISPVNSTLNNESLLFIDGEYSIIQRNENVGNAIIRGARFEIDAAISTNLDFHTIINFTKGSSLLSDNPISHIPPTFGRSSIGYSKDIWSLQGFILFSGAKSIDDYGSGNTDNPDEALSVGTPSWWTLNIESRFEIHKNIHAQLGLSNLLDLHYKTFSSGISAPGRGVFIALNATF